MDWRELWYDVSPMRPDEHARQMAGAWTRAELLQKAFKDGAAAANRERERAEETQRKQEESLRNLKEQHG